MRLVASCVTALRCSSSWRWLIHVHWILIRVLLLYNRTCTYTDEEPPSISGCPTSFSVATDRGKDTSFVNWTEPTAQDNSGSVTIRQSDGPPRLSDFAIGFHTIRYVAEDDNGNESPECVFFVQVYGMYKSMIKHDKYLPTYISVSTVLRLVQISSAVLQAKGSSHLINKLFHTVSGN